ncbi:MAG: HAD family hydrolase [Clostridiales bacterium]|nr:HAD family hydrolase [Clostridiales bacterium]
MVKKDRLIFWDIDGTLLHCGSNGRKALNRTFLELYGITDALGKSPVGASMDSMLLGGIMKNFGIDPKDFPKITQHYKTVLKEILEQDNNKRILPGVIPILEAIDKHPQAINALLTSNLRVGAEAKLSSVGLDKYFRIGGFGDDIGEKWDAAIKCIEMAEEQFNTLFPKDQIYLIGDSCYDIVCAKKVGMKSIAVATGWTDISTLQECKPDYFFPDLSDTEKILEIINI